MMTAAEERRVREEEQQADAKRIAAEEQRMQQRRKPTMAQRGRVAVARLRALVVAAIEMYRRIKEQRRSGYELGDSGQYEGSHKPATKLDKLTNLEVPTWSTSLFIPMDNLGMFFCALTGLGMCWLHGHTQDAMTGSGCCYSCCTGFCSCMECGRQRRYMRKRFGMPGGDYYCEGYKGDCFEAVCCMPLAVLQEGREIEIRTQRKWTWLRGFRGVGEDVYVTFCGEETLENVLVPFECKPRDVLAVPQGQEGSDDESVGSADLEAPAYVSAMSR